MAPFRDYWALDPDIVYLNHGALGACPTAVLQEQRRLQTLMEREPVLFADKTYYELIEVSRIRLSAYLNADAAGLAFVANATAGINAVLQSYPLQPGDEILLTNHGYGACLNAAKHNAQKRGASIKIAEIPFPVNGESQIIEGVLAAVTPRTRLALLDHVTSPTALIFPVEKLTHELQTRGIDVAIDGAHAPGMLRLDLEGLRPAYYSGNCHKWMCGPRGSAFLYARSDKRDSLFPTVISHGFAMSGTVQSRYHNLFDWTGTFDPSPWLSLPFLIDFMNSLCDGGWDEIYSRNRAAVMRAAGKLADSFSLEIGGPDHLLGSMVSLLIPSRTQRIPDCIAPALPGKAHWASPRLHRCLLDCHKIEVPVHRWGNGAEILRISAQLYNPDSDFERLHDALEQIL